MLLYFVIYFSPCTVNVTHTTKLDYLFYIILFISVYVSLCSYNFGDPSSSWGTIWLISVDITVDIMDSDLVVIVLPRRYANTGPIAVMMYLRCEIQW
jgi:hypothetical protein